MKALIVDDERLARKELMKLLEEHPSIEIVGEAQNADEAEAMITELNPDLLFLDIQMPGRTGFQLLESLDTVPLVVFTTAYDEFAIKAFEVSALDYLLKPITAERLAEAVHKVLKGLYAKARAGKIPNFTGIDSPYEVPEAPELRLDTQAETPEALAESVVQRLLD